ncbi:cytochrome b/b6 domain-containing protein [Shewanella surugensis]|uniref:Cytochrome b/b6 domain-containing protein n=1 Tax=Shewanella surugensis TaxID=212020 RepID=A0ABT0L5W3_9GAMM|nr:cytochrome b/b6 domain-containing protein [Shewanella surugensis]MCL1123073.1 cytochrome b/b6 domain-containing protein [Shewanella surugensis]
MDQTRLSIKVWDVPTRLFHWLMVGLIGGLWWTASVGEMQWHQLLGYVLLNLVLCRLIWGLIGSDTARFSFFMVSPKRALMYLWSRSEHKPTLGHNPIGGYMVLLLILLLCIQLVSGLFATDEIFTEGPLFSYVSSSTSAWLTWLHKNNFDLLLVFSSMHVLAVLVHLFKGDNLITAMFTGSKSPVKAQHKPIKFVSSFIALGAFLVIGSVIFYYWVIPLLSML